MGVRFGRAERDYLKQVMDSEILGSHRGTMTKRFEESFARKLGSKSGVAMNSAMSVLHSAVAAAEVGPGDEVICDPVVHFGAVAVMYNNGVPVFCDIDEHTFLIDPGSLEERITERTKAIICTHLFGLPCDMDSVMKLAENHGLMVIEDTAQALGATYKGRMAGTLGHIGVFSFEQSKHITSGDGGIGITGDGRLADRMRVIRIIGWRPEEHSNIAERWKE